MRFCLLLLLLPLLLVPSFVSPAWSQGFDMARGTSEIQISADDGLEWQSEANRVIAHGNAKAVRGDMTVTADTLTAYYRSNSTKNAPAPAGQPPGGGSQIWRVEADGNVTITNPTDTATGTKAIYDLDKAVLVLKGSPANLTTPTETFTADEQLEYWEDQHMAVLRGNGVATTKDKKIQGDVLTAHFKDHRQGPKSQKSANSGKSGGNGGMELSRADAFGHVILTTPQDKATGDRGDYNAESGIATLTGMVTLTRDTNIMTGRYARVDMNSGISNLYGYQPDETKQRVQATFNPAHKEDKPKQ